MDADGQAVAREEAAGLIVLDEGAQLPDLAAEQVRLGTPL
jgi:hypothetical protein